MTYRIFDRMTGTAAAALLGTALLAAPLGASAQQSMPAAPSAAPAAPQAAPEAAPAPSESAAAPSAKSHRTPMKRVEAQIKRLHSELKITPDQSSQWDGVAQAMRDQAQEMEQLEQQRDADRDSMNAVDDLKSYQAIAEAHAKEMGQLVPAFETLYNSMSPEQKKTADAVFMPRPKSTSKRKSKSG